MKKIDQIFSKAFLQLERSSEVERMAAQSIEDEPDITKPQSNKEQAPAPLTSKGEEYLLKLAYLALLYTPKEEEMIQIKNTFETSGIHDENSIQAETPQSIEDVKNIIVNILGMNDTSAVASQLNQIPQND